jgi:hypothetical protein
MLFPVLLYALKFLAATAITVFWILTLLKHKGILASLAVSILTAVISFVVFSILLGVVLPGGFLEKHLLRLW